MKFVFLIIDVDRFYCLVNIFNNICLLLCFWLYFDVRKKIYLSIFLLNIKIKGVE